MILVDTSVCVHARRQAVDVGQTLGKIGRALWCGLLNFANRELKFQM
jgi:hypothetical protein